MHICLQLNIVAAIPSSVLKLNNAWRLMLIKYNNAETVVNYTEEMINKKILTFFSDFSKKLCNYFNQMQFIKSLYSNWNLLKVSEVRKKKRVIVSNNNNVWILKLLNYNLMVISITILFETATKKHWILNDLSLCQKNHSNMINISNIWFKFANHEQLITNYIWN